MSLWRLRRGGITGNANRSRKILQAFTLLWATPRGAWYSHYIIFIIYFVLDLLKICCINQYFCSFINGLSARIFHTLWGAPGDNGREVYQGRVCPYLIILVNWHLGQFIRTYAGKLRNRVSRRYLCVKTMIYCQNLVSLRKSWINVCSGF